MRTVLRRRQKSQLNRSVYFAHATDFQLTIKAPLTATIFPSATAPITIADFAGQRATTLRMSAS